MTPATREGTETDTDSSFGEWVEALVQAADELATSALSFDGIERLGETPGLPDPLEGAFIALVGEDTNVQFGLVGDETTCASLARSLLFMEPEDELCDEDVADAVNEVANILGGGVKRRMMHRDSTLKLGLPVFIKGTIHSSSHLEAWTVAVNLGPVPVKLVALRHHS